MTAAPQTTSAAQPRLTPAGALLIVLLVGAAVRLLLVPAVSLIITNDGTDYLAYAERILAGNWTPFRADRTPGYSALLAAVIAACGPSASAIAAVQHALALTGAALLAWWVALRGGPWAGLVAGLCAALDPWLLAYSSHALTESLNTFALLLLSAIVMLPTRRARTRAVVLGACLAAACLVRPPFQILMPFCVLGCALAADHRWSRRVGLMLLAGATFLAALSPWLYFQHARTGRAALSFGSGAHLFSGLARAGLLDERFPLPEPVRDAYAPLAGRPLDDGDFWRFAWQVDALQTGEAVLRDWSLASIRARPRGYAGQVARAALWQMNLNVGSPPPAFRECNEAVIRVGQPGDGRQYEPGPPNELLDRLNVTRPQGLLKRGIARIAPRLPHGLPQLPLLVLAIAGAAWAALHRDVALCALLLGTLAFLAVHAAFLFPNARYALPLWTLWYALPPLMIRAALATRRAATAAR